MARRSDIAGLAALAALGYGILKSRKGDNKPDADMQRELARSTRGQVAMEEEDPDYARELARADRGQVGIGATNRAPASTTSAVPRAETKPSEGKSGGRGLAEATDQRQDSRQRQLRDREAVMMSRGRREEGPPRVNVGRTPSRVATVTDIPGSSPEGWTGGTGERVTGSELSRNISNTLNATAGLSAVGPMVNLGRGRAAARGSTALATRSPDEAVFLGASGRRAINEADQLGYEAGKRLGYEEGKRLAQSTAPRQLPGPARQIAGPRSEPLTEADWTGGAIGFKRGGKVSAKAKPEPKSNAKGWGKARGARQAKIY